MTDDIERNVHVNYGADQAQNFDELLSSFRAAKTDVLRLLDENYRLRDLNRHAGKRIHQMLQKANGHLS